MKNHDISNRDVSGKFVPLDESSETGQILQLLLASPCIQDYGLASDPLVSNIQCHVSFVFQS